MKNEVHKHIETHVSSVLTNWQNNKWGANSEIEKSIVYKHLKLLVRWYAQIDINGRDSYDNRKKPLILMKNFGMSSGLYELFCKLCDFQHKPHDEGLKKIIDDEYTAAQVSDSTSKLFETLQSSKLLGYKEINSILTPLVFYEHMTPSDVIVKELLDTYEISKLNADDYYVLIIKKSQQLKLDGKGSKFRRFGRSEQRLCFINDRKATKSEMIEFSRRLSILEQKLANSP